MKRSPLKRRKPNKTSPAAKAFKKVKAKSLSKLGEELWVSLSWYIRERDNWTCYTCGHTVDKTDWKARSGLHAGHFISRRNAATKYDPLNVKGQCRICNLYGYGKSHLFAARLIEDHGIQAFNHLIERSKKTKQWTSRELTHLISVLKERPQDYESEYRKLITNE